MTKQLVCGSFGNIYYAQLLKDGSMSATNRVELTDQALMAVVGHMTCKSDYIENGYTGYGYNTQDGNIIELAAFDADKYEVRRKDEV